jgi:hypothetical protein
MNPFPAPDWSTAMVVAEADEFELEVRLVGNIPEDWRETCNELAKQGAPQGGAWREMTFSSETLVVSGLQDDAQESLKAFVTGLVAPRAKLSSRAERQRARLLRRRSRTTP